MEQPDLRSLLDAVVPFSADLDLAGVLHRITRAACELVGARYGALGVLGPDGRHLAGFFTHGLSDEERLVQTMTGLWARSLGLPRSH